MQATGVPQCSVIVLNWNGRAHLPECLEALSRQTFRDFELIVVDNGSTDGSVEWIKGHHPEVRVIALPQNRGFSGGNNGGLKAALGSHVILLNNDTRPEADLIERLSTCADTRKQAGIVAAHLVDWEGSFTDSAGDGCRVTGRCFGRHRRRPASEAPPSGPVFGACAGAALYRRECIEDVGFLDEDFFLNFEDCDLSFRARLRGWQVWFCREAVVRHRMSATQGTWSRINTYYGSRNHIWVCLKNMPSWLLFKYAPLNLLQVAAVGAVAARHGQAWPYFKGILDGIIGAPKMLRKRREIMARRTLSTPELERLLSPLNLNLGALRRLLRHR